MLIRAFVPAWLGTLRDRLSRGRPLRPSRRTPWARSRPCLEELEDRLAPATFVVTSPNDSGPGSLRQAIRSSSAAAGADTINFNIPSLTGGPSPSRLVSALPTLTGPVTIAGDTQPGFRPGVPLVELNGARAGAGANGLALNASGCVVRGLIIDRFGGNGVLAMGAHRRRRGVLYRHQRRGHGGGGQRLPRRFDRRAGLQRPRRRHHRRRPQRHLRQRPGRCGHSGERDVREPRDRQLHRDRRHGNGRVGQRLGRRAGRGRLQKQRHRRHHGRRRQRHLRQRRRRRRHLRYGHGTEPGSGEHYRQQQGRWRDSLRRYLQQPGGRQRGHRSQRHFRKYRQRRGHRGPGHDGEPGGGELHRHQRRGHRGPGECPGWRSHQETAPPATRWGAAPWAAPATSSPATAATGWRSPTPARRRTWCGRTISAPTPRPPPPWGIPWMAWESLSAASTRWAAPPSPPATSSPAMAATG